MKPQLTLQTPLELPHQEISNYLIVALNSDEWLIKKKKKFFMSVEERKNILMNA